MVDEKEKIESKEVVSSDKDKVEVVGGDVEKSIEGDTRDENIDTPTRGDVGRSGAEEKSDGKGKEIKEDDVKSIDAGDNNTNKNDKDNIIYIGIKPFMNYVTGVVMQFNNKGQDEVIVSARGKFISKAVDVVEVARRTFLKDDDIKVENIGINSEQFENKEGKRIYVSTIEIRMIKN
jgi:DNA-binding protein